jgi:hypothetical protein
MRPPAILYRLSADFRFQPTGNLEAPAADSVVLALGQDVEP